jgi:hypothetical protein
VVPHRDTSEPGGPHKGKPEPPAPGDPLRGTPDSGGLSGAPHQVMSFSGGRQNFFVLLAATAEPQQPPQGELYPEGLLMGGPKRTLRHSRWFLRHCWPCRGRPQNKAGGLLCNPSEPIGTHWDSVQKWLSGDQQNTGKGPEKLVCLLKVCEIWALPGAL